MNKYVSYAIWLSVLPALAVAAFSAASGHSGATAALYGLGTFFASAFVGLTAIFLAETGA